MSPRVDHLEQKKGARCSDRTVDESNRIRPQWSYIATRGGDAPIVFVDADEMHDAITLSGGYIVNGEDLIITAVLVKNNEPLGSEIKVEGNVADKEVILKRLIVEMIKVAK